MLLSVTERGRSVLDLSVASALVAKREFGMLCDAGYVSLQVGGSTSRLVGHKYVGRAVIGDVELRVNEKVDGALVSLVAAATGAELRTELLSAPAGDFDAVSRILLEIFIDAAGRYVADRRVPRYEYELRESPVLQGSLRLGPTIRAWASGRPGRFVFEAGRVVRDSPLDRVVLASLDEIDRSGPLLGLSPAILYRARWLAGGLEDVRDEQYLLTNRDEHLHEARVLESDPSTTPVDADLARLAAVTLLHHGFALSDDMIDARVPRAWFVDLESLFERAVRSRLDALLVARGIDVDRGETHARRLFTAGSDKSKVNPDLVIGDGPWAVGDVKYKSLAVALGEDQDPEDPQPRRRKKEKRPDLYQVLVHAAAMGAPRALLVYASDDVFEPRYLGEAATGARTWAAQVRPTHLDADLATLLGVMGLPV